jgi:hypothetical protein
MKTVFASVISFVLEAVVCRSSARAMANLSAICKNHLPDNHQIEIVDLLQDPRRVLSDKILATLDPAKFSGLTEGDATHPQRRRPRQRGCHSVPGHFVQTAREEPGDCATGRDQGGDPSRRGIGLVEIPFVEPEAEVCQADLLGVLVESGRRLPAPRFESKVAIDVMKPENA